MCLFLKYETSSQCHKGIEKYAACINYTTCSGSKTPKASSSATMDQLVFSETKNLSCSCARSRGLQGAFGSRASPQPAKGQKPGAYGGQRGPSALALAQLLSG